MEQIENRPKLGTESQGWALSVSPAKMAFIMTIVIFLAEFCVMLLIDRLPSLSPLVEAVVDSCFLIAFLVPAYIAFYRPFWQAQLNSQEEIQQLNHRLTAATEDEKRRIALDLHDHCDQTLVALQKTVELVQSKVIDTSEEAAALCQEIDELLGRLNHDVRTVSAALHPPQLEEQGLGPALQKYFGQLQLKISGINIEFLEKGTPCPVAMQKAIAIYRIGQEAVKNAIDHAESGFIRVHLEYSPTAVAVSVVDNGIGFNTKKISTTQGLGIVNMRERARAHGGTLIIHSEEGRGTSLRANFKL